MGVRRAEMLAKKAARSAKEEHRPVYSYGLLIHNAKENCTTLRSLV